MAELPIHPERRESPGYELTRRLNGLGENRETTLRATYEVLALECAHQTLRLTGSSDEVDDEALIGAQLDVLTRLSETARLGRSPTIAFIAETHEVATPGAESGLRRLELEPQFQNARPSPPRFVEAKLQNLIDWLEGESGSQMFAAERMALWFARFLEIAPFTRGNFRTAHLWVNYFAASSKFPPVSLRFEEADAIRSEVERAMTFDTAPLVSRFVDSLSRSVTALEEASEAG